MANEQAVTTLYQVWNTATNDMVGTFCTRKAAEDCAVECDRKCGELRYVVRLHVIETTKAFE